MKTIRITFSLRDWKQGQEVLQRLDILPEGDLFVTDNHTITIPEWLEEEMKEELASVDVEFDID